MKRPIYGIAAEFTSASELYEAAKKVRDRGFKRWDVHSPFPIHGMDEAMGLKKSPLAYFVFCGGLFGALLGFFLAYYPSVIEYPLVVDGKPNNIYTVPAFFPVIFELTILLSAFTVVGGMLVMNRLPRWHHPVFNWDGFKKVSDDGFVLVIEAEDPRFSETSTPEFLEKIGAQKVSVIEEEENEEVSA